MHLSRFAAAIAGTAVAVLGCSSDDETGTTTGGTPTITITSPIEGATVPAEIETSGTDVEVATEIEFTVTNFTLKAPTTCGGAEGCGQVFVKVDGDDCNDADEEKLPYNELIFASPGDADLLYCKGVTLDANGVMGADGKHAISLELHNDDGSAVKDSSGKVVHADVNVTVEVETEGTGGEGVGGGGVGGSAGGAGGAGGG